MGPQFKTDEALLFKRFYFIDTPPDAIFWNREGTWDKEYPVVQLFLHLDHIMGRDLSHAGWAGIEVVIVLHPEQSRQRNADGSAPLVHSLYAFYILILGIHVGMIPSSCFTA